VLDLPAAALLRADVTHPSIRSAVAAVDLADALVVGTPVYKASFSGLLKTFLDVLPQKALVGKTVLPLASGGTIAHLLSIDYALRPVLLSLCPRHVAPGRCCSRCARATSRRAGSSSTRSSPRTIRAAGSSDPDARAAVRAVVRDFVAESAGAEAALTA
jgi:FMN reductase